jgi:TP901 family phage tail tape measure protein
MADISSKLKVIFTGNAKQLTKELDKVGKDADKAGLSLANMGKKVGKAGIVAAGAIASLGAVLTGKVIANSLRTFIAYEEQLLRVGAIAKLSGEELVAFDADLRNVAAGSRFTASETAKAAEVLAMAGLTFDQLSSDGEGAVEFLATFAELAGGDIEMAAGISISAIKAFGMEISELDRVGNVMTNTFTSSFVSLETLGQGLKFLAPTAAAAGVSLEESAAAIGALGNAGLQGTIAGTGLRMAINKLIAPTEDARRTMDRLGLDFLRLTPAGESARATFRRLSTQIDSLKRDIQLTTNELNLLNGQMTDMSIQEQRNSLAISRIRQRARREGRELNKEEIKSIERLEEANDGLSIQQQELSIQSQVLQREQNKNTDTLSDMESAATAANDTMNSQVTGITSLVDVIDQLNEVGATTAEILEIFSVRGGTAIMALLGQADAFREMTAANEDSGQAMEDMMDRIEPAIGRKLAILRSHFEETSLQIAETFLEGFDMDAFINGLTDISTAVQENKGEFKELGIAIGASVMPIIKALPEFMSSIMATMAALKPVITLVAILATGLLGVLTLFGLLLRFIDFIFTQIGNLISAIPGMGNHGAAIGDLMSAGSQGAVTGGLAGAGVGAAFGGIGAAPGAIGGAAVGGALGIIGEGMTMLAEGGVVTRPTLAVVGEAGPEAVIPLDRATGFGSGTGTVINFGPISINGNLGAGEVREIIRSEFPRILKNSYASGARGVV